MKMIKLRPGTDTRGPILVARPAGSYNGSTHPSGGCYLGSNPSPAALVIKNNMMILSWFSAKG